MKLSGERDASHLTNEEQALEFKEKSAMREFKEYANSKVVNRLRVAAMAIFVMGIAAGPVVYAAGNAAAKAKSEFILVRPADLPDLARQAGEALLLHATNDGRRILYVEQNGGAQLAIFDVTDPSSIKREHSAQIDAAGTFDFVFALGDSKVLVRYRQGQEEAVLDLRKIWAPEIKSVQGLKLRDLTEPLGDEGFTATSQAEPSATDYKVAETASSRDDNDVFDVQDVRGMITNEETGTTFLLTGEGLYIVRRPAVEEEAQLRANQLRAGG
jgi:hypothetical protein